MVTDSGVESRSGRLGSGRGQILECSSSTWSGVVATSFLDMEFPCPLDTSKHVVDLVVEESGKPIYSSFHGLTSIEK
ncbi:hypothetical protein YC2023_022581 [Brassica napus]